MQEMEQQKLKILCSLDEIKEKGYEVKTLIPKEKRCPYCNKILEIKGILNPKGKYICAFIQSEKCNCRRSIDERNKLVFEKEEKQKEEYEKFRKEEMNKKIKQYYGTDFITRQFKIKTLDNFITNNKNIKTKLAAQKFIQKFKEMKNGIIFVGTNGTGKTHISIAIANELMKQNVPVIFGTLTDLLEKYKDNCKNNTENELIKLYTKVDLLIIDDLGVEFMNDWMLSKLFVIINERIKNELPIIITTNYDMDQLKQRLSIQNKLCETTNSIISRLCCMCYRVECKGNDYRMI